MTAGGPWLLTPLAGALIGLTGVAIGVIGCLLTIWYARMARSRRRLLYNVRPRTRPAEPFIEQGRPGYRKRVDVEIALWLAGPAAIRPDDFIDGLPLHFSIGGAEIVSESVRGDLAARAYYNWLKIGPQWLTAGRPLSINLQAIGLHVVVGPGPAKPDAKPSVRLGLLANPIADVQLISIRRWRMGLKVVPIRKRIAKLATKVAWGATATVAFIAFFVVLISVGWYVLRRLEREERQQRLRQNSPEGTPAEPSGNPTSGSSGEVLKSKEPR